MSSDPSATGPRRNIRIGKYEVIAHVATGGMGAVYKARDIEQDREVALKVMSPEMAAKPAMLERFRREARHAAKLRHENVVTLYEFGEASETFFLVMEFIDGIDLHDYLVRKGTLNPDEALNIITQCARAIDHTYQQGLVHRDIKPSNFLITHKGDRLIVKMTDLGLARQADNEEIRVTRAGTTVGTLDYMSPEQARDSGKADIRSDLYSLGSTWYHLLAGQPPFPKGNLTERLQRIMNEAAPDIRDYNPAVSDGMAAVLHRLLAKRRSHRYQTPADLLRDLDNLAKGQSPSVGLKTREKKDSVPVERVPTPRKPSRVSSGTQKTPRSLPSPTRVDSQAGKSTVEAPISRTVPQSRPMIWYGICAAFAVVLIVAGVLAFVLRDKPADQTVAQQPDNPGETSPVAAPPILTPYQGGSTAKRKQDSDASERTLAAEPPKKTTWPVLYRPSQPIDNGALRKEIEAPWAKVPALGPTVDLVVGRLSAGSSVKHYSSLAAACKAIPAGATGIIELHDNGPFFDLPTTLADRSLVVRPAKGFHPLLVWDVPRMVDERRRNPDKRDGVETSTPPVFFDIKRGNLTLQELHIALKWPDTSSEGAAVIRVEDGDVSLTNCTFSVAGKPRDGVTVVRLTNTKPEVGRCRVSRCYARGAAMSFVDLNAPGSATLIEDSLLVGGDTPLIQVRAGNDQPTRLSSVRSTMVCGKTLLTLRRARNTDHDPAFHWLGWDALLGRKNADVGGELVHLLDDCRTRNINWRAVNCLYVGWETLLTGASSIPSTDISGWRRQWGRIEGDYTRSETWPNLELPDMVDAPANSFRTADSPVAFASSANPEKPLGCDVDRLPPVRDNGLSLAFEHFAIVAPSIPDDGGPPEIKPATDQLYHGEKLDLTRIDDLGAYLREVQRTSRLAPEIALHLFGTGEHRTSPIQLKGHSLVLYFEPTSEAKEPLVLVPAVRGPGEALIEIEQGNLSIINGRLTFAQKDDARGLPWLIKLRGGEARLFRTHLEVPPKKSGTTFRGLISLTGSGEAAAENVSSCAANESVLVSDRDAIGVQGIGVRLLLTQTLVIAGGEAVRLSIEPDFSRQNPGTAKKPSPRLAGRANVQCLFDHTTIAARGAVLHLSDVKQNAPLAEPVLVQTHHCGFVNLFTSRAIRPGLVVYDGEALAHGLLVWQSENDAFDKRLWFAARSSADPLPEKPEDRSGWPSLWGSPNLARAQLDLTVYRTLDSTWALERLVGWKAPGARLEALDLARRISGKLPR